MRKLLIFLLIFISIVVRSQELSHDQYALITDGWVNNDVVGQWDSLYTTADTSALNFRFYIVTNEDNIYAVDSATGIVTVANNTSLAYGIDTISIRTKLGQNLDDTNNLYIDVRDEDSTRFIAPGAAGTNSGTRANPWTTWDSANFADIRYDTYLQKRGTTMASYQVPIASSEDGTASNWKAIGAYSTGARPIIDRNSASVNLVIRGSYWKIFEYKFIDGYGLHVEADYPVDHLLLSDLEFSANGGNNGQLYLKSRSDCTYYRSPQYVEVYDIYAHDVTDEHNIKIEKSGITARNIRVNTTNSSHHGLSCPTHCTYSTFTYVLAYDCDASGIEMSGQNLTCEKFISRNNYNNISCDDSAGYNIHFVDGLVNDSYGSNIILDPFTVAGADRGRKIILENLEITGAGHINAANTASGIYIDEQADSVVIIGCNIHDNDSIGIRINDATIDSVYIINNLIYNHDQNVTVDNYNTAGTVHLWNNTVLKSNNYDVNNRTAKIIDFGNCIYQDLYTVSGEIVDTACYDYDTGDPFIDYANNDYGIALRTHAVVGGGHEFGLNQDYYDHYYWMNAPCIGAIDYYNAQRRLIKRNNTYFYTQLKGQITERLLTK